MRNLAGLDMDTSPSGHKAQKTQRDRHRLVSVASLKTGIPHGKSMAVLGYPTD